MGSGSGETSVHRNGLITMARFWDGSAVTIGDTGLDAQSLTCNGDTGAFTEFVSVYNQLAGDIAQWCGQGHTQMDKIGSALVIAAKRYDNTENRNSAAAAGVNSGHH